MTKHSDGVRTRLRQFFVDNPHEELTMQQISVKFGVGMERARDVVGELCQTGEIENVRVVRSRAKGVAK